MTDIEKMTQKSQQAMQAAAQLAESNQNPTVEPEHLVFSLLSQDEGIVPRVLESMNVQSMALKEAMNGRIQNFPKVSGDSVRVTASHALTRVFQEAEKIAKQLGDSFISTEHFFLAALKTAREIQRIAET